MHAVAVLLFWALVGLLSGVLLWGDFPATINRHLRGETAFGRVVNRSVVAARRARIRRAARRR